LKDLADLLTDLTNAKKCIMLMLHTEAFSSNIYHCIKIAAETKYKKPNLTVRGCSLCFNFSDISQQLTNGNFFQCQLGNDEHFTTHLCYLLLSLQIYENPEIYET